MAEAVTRNSGPDPRVTKLVAFRSRGQGDYWMSTHIEDIVSVIDGRPELVSEVRIAGAAVRNYPAAGFHASAGDEEFSDSLAGQFQGEAVSQACVAVVLSHIRSIAVLA